MNRFTGICVGAMVVLISTTAQSAVRPSAGARLNDHQRTVSSLLEFEQERAQAEATRNGPALRRELADDLQYIHGGGNAINKNQYLAEYVGSGDSDGMRIVGIHLDGEIGEVQGNAGITSGIIVKEIKKNMFHVARYTGIYRYKGGRWSLVRWQTTDLYRPEAPKQ